MSIAPVPEPSLDTDDVLNRAEANLVAVRQAESERMVIARDWVLANPPDPEQLARAPICAKAIGSAGVLVLQHTDAELAAALQMHPLAAQRLMGDAIDLDRRMPMTWDALSQGRVECWVARKIVGLTACLGHEQARWVDEQIADIVGTLPAARLLKVVEARVAEADPALADQPSRRASEVARRVAGPRHRSRDS